MSSKQSKSLWGGRFTETINCSLADLNCSLNEDARLFAEDLNGSKAYAEALERAKIISKQECEAIHQAIELIRFDWIEKVIEFRSSDEDVHTVNERLIVKICGSAGEKLHTGRSRNDQVVTDVKLWMKRAIHEIIVSIGNVIEAMTYIADEFQNVVMPGYTHLQRAQPVLFGHWIFSHAFALREDCSRFKDLFQRVNVLPLGSGALAGNPLKIDREFLAQRLGFSRITQNSMHAVGDRDNIAEFNFNASMTSLHLSRLAEDLIIYSTKEFNLVQISDSFSTGSSLMPQKRNPDSLELVRGMAGSIFGAMSGFLMTMKGLPSTYNKDLQFDKKGLFSAFDSLKKILSVTEGVVKTMKINAAECKKALSPDMLATDWAYYLVNKGVPFRTAHHLVGKLISLAEVQKKDILQLPLHELQSVCDLFSVDVENCSDFRKSVEQYDVVGGTSSSSVKNQSEILKRVVQEIQNCTDINRVENLHFL